MNITKHEKKKKNWICCHLMFHAWIIALWEKELGKILILSGSVLAVYIRLEKTFEFYRYQLYSDLESSNQREPMFVKQTCPNAAHTYNGIAEKVTKVAVLLYFCCIWNYFVICCCCFTQRRPTTSWRLCSVVSCLWSMSMVLTR